MAEFEPRTTDFLGNLFKKNRLRHFPEFRFHYSSRIEHLQNFAEINKVGKICN